MATMPLTVATVTMPVSTPAIMANVDAQAAAANVDAKAGAADDAIGFRAAGRSFDGQVLRFAA